MADEKTTFKTDYAASNRSKCNRCRQPIDQQELRIGPMVQSDKGDFKYPQWHHFACFEDGWMKKHQGELVDALQVAGIDRLKFEDQKRIKGLIVAGDSTAERKAQTEEEKRLAAESKLVWNKAQALEALSNAELQELLEANDQPNSGKIFGGRNNMIQRAADAMVFGAIAKCSVCGDGDLYFSHGQYKCSGNVDEFTKCENKCTDVKRGKFEVPEDLRESYAFLKAYKFKAREKATVTIEAVNETATAVTRQRKRQAEDSTQPQTQASTGDAAAAAPAGDGAAAAAEDDANAAAAKGCFAGCLVTCCGKLSRTQKAVQELITSNGGRFSSSIAADICVTTSAEVSGKGSQKGSNAVKQGLLCVNEAWIDESIKAGHRLLGDELSPFVLANGRTADATRKQRAELGDKLDAVAEAQAQRAKLEENFTTKSAAKSAVKKVVVKNAGGAVDEDSGLTEDGHIYVKGSDTFNATLNLADVSTGQNSYYVLQIIEHDRKQQWSCFRKWGKVGDSSIGASKITDYPLVDAAVREFKKVSKEKTGNDWDGRKNFQKVYGKFTWIDIDYTASEGPSAGPASAPMAADYQGPLDRATRDFVSLIFDMKVMSDTLKELEIDTEKMPLGKLSKATIAKGFQALAELQNVLVADPDAATTNRTKVLSLTNQFYNYIPHSAPDGGKLALLSSLDDVKRKTELLQALQEMEVASKLMSSANADAAAGGTHPIDANYSKLKTELKGVERGSELWKRIDTYLQNTHGATHTTYSLELVDLLEMNHEGDDAKFAPHAQDPNRMLLWHGSRLTNWVGIISQGLRIAPPEAPSTGYMFGKGAYFADMSSKSANYCFTTSEKTTGILMLCEVALGNMKQRKGAFFETTIPNKTHQSTFGMGKNAPDPKGAFHEDSGCVIPMGKGTSSGVHDTTLLYNEFIVYDTAQVRPRYLLRLNFNYKKKAGTFF